MLKYIQEILQNLAKESPKSKIKHNKIRTDSYALSKRKTSINPGILAPAGDEKHKFENTHHVLKIRKAYDLLMKRLVSPNLELLPKCKILEQIKNMDIKKQQEMFSSLFLNKSVDKIKKKKLPGAPFDEKFYNEEKLQQNSTKCFAIGWSGQATTKESLRPTIEVASKYPYDISSAFFDYTDVKELNSKPLEKESKKKLKKISKRRKKSTDHLSTDNSKAKKSVQLIKEIPKSRISKFYRLDVERRQRAALQKALEPLKEVNISGSLTTKTCADGTETEIQPVSPDVVCYNTSDKTNQPEKDPKSSGEETEFQEGRDLINTNITDNWKELSENNHIQDKKQTNNINSNNQDFKIYDEKIDIKQICSIENKSPENNLKEKDTEDYMLTKLREKHSEIVYHQENSDHVSSKNKEKGSILRKDDQMDLINESDLGKSSKSGNNSSFSINIKGNENYTHFTNKNMTDYDEKSSSDEINKTDFSGKPPNNKDPHLTFGTGKIKNRLETILEQIDLKNVSVKNLEKEDRLKEKSTSSQEILNYLNQQSCTNQRPPVKDNLVSNKVFKKEHTESSVNLSCSEIPSKLKKYKKVKTGNFFSKKYPEKSEDVAGDIDKSNRKILTNFRESLFPSKSKSNLRNEIIKDLLNKDSLLKNEICSPTKTAQNLVSKSTGSLAKKKKSCQIVSSKVTRRKRVDLSKNTAKLYMKEGTENESDTIITSNLSSLRKEKKGSNNLNNNKQSTTLSKTKQVVDKTSITDLKRLSSNTISKFKGALKKPKIEGVVNSGYEKFVKNKAWFSGSLSKSSMSKSDVSTSFKGDAKEKTKGSLQFSHFKVTDIHAQNKESVFIKGTSQENTKKNELNDILSNKEKQSCNLESSKQEKRVLKIKTGIKDPKTNENCEFLKLAKPLRKVLDSNVQKAVNRLEQNQNSSIRSNLSKQTACNVNGKVTNACPLNDGNSNLMRKTEPVSNKTKSSLSLSKYLFEVSKPVLSKENKNDDSSLNFSSRKSNLTLKSAQDLSTVKNTLNHNLLTKGCKKSRKLHSKKLDPKSSELKMYGEGKSIIPISDVCSLKSVQVVHRNDKIKTNVVSSLPTRLESRKVFSRNFKNEIVQSSKKIFPIAVQKRNLCSAQDTASIIVSYICKNFSTKTAAKSFENNYFGHRTTSNSFQKSGIIVGANNFFKMNDNLEFKPNVKRTIIRNGIKKIPEMELNLSEPLHSLRRKGKKSNITKTSEGDITRSGGTKLTQKKDYSLKVLYERNKTKSEDHIFNNFQHQSNKPQIQKPEFASGDAFKTCVSNNRFQTFHNPLKYEERNSIKRAVLSNINTTEVKQSHNISLPKQIIDHNLIKYKLDNNMSEENKLKNNKKEKVLETEDKDLMTIKPSQRFQPTSHNKLNNLSKDSKVNDKIEKKGHSLFNIREGVPEKRVSARTEFSNNYPVTPRGIQSLSNLKYTYMEPVGLSKLQPQRWRSKLDRLNNFLFRSNRSEVRIKRKRTVIKSLITNYNTKSNNLNKAALKNILNLTGDNKKHELNTNDTSLQTLNRKVNQISNVKVFLQDSTKQLDDLSYKTKVLKNISPTIGKQFSDKEVTLINAKQKAILPLESKLVSKTPLNRNSWIKIRNEFETSHEPDILGKNINTDKVELIKRPVNKPILNEHKATITTNTLLDSNKPNKLSFGKINDNSKKNEVTIDFLLNCYRQNSDKTKSSEIQNNKNNLLVQTVPKRNKETNENIPKQDKKSEQVKLDIELNSKSQKPNKPVTIQHLSGLDCSLMKMEEEPQTLAKSFALNFNLPFNITAQNLKKIEDSKIGNNKENSELNKKSIAKKYYDQLQVLKTVVPINNKQAIAVVGKQESAHQTDTKSLANLNSLSNFKANLKPIDSKNKNKFVQNFSNVSKKEKYILEKENEKLNKNILSKPLKSLRPSFPFNIVDTKSHLMKSKSQPIKQEQSKTINNIILTSSVKKPVIKTPRFPAGLLAKHLKKAEKRITTNSNKGSPSRSNKLETPREPKTSKINKSIETKLDRTRKQMLLSGEKEKITDIKKGLITITGSNSSLNFNKLIKSKVRDKFYLSSLTKNAKTKQEDRESVHEGKLLQDNKKATKLTKSAKLIRNNAFGSNKCLEKIVDYGIENSESNHLHKGLIKSLKMIKNSEKCKGNCKLNKLKNIPSCSSVGDSSNCHTKIQDQLSNTASLEIGATNCSMSSEDIGRMKSIIRSTNNFKILKGDRKRKKGQLQLIEINSKFGQHLYKKKCEKHLQSKEHSKITGTNTSKSPSNKFIYLSPVDPQTKGVYVVEIPPSNVEEAPIDSSSEVLKERNVSFDKNHIPNIKLKSCKSR